MTWLLALSQRGLLGVWVAFAAVATAGVVAVFIWAVRSGQFRNQDRARRLPLDDDDDK